MNERFSFTVEDSKGRHVFKADTRPRALRKLRKYLAEQEQERVIERLHGQERNQGLREVFLWSAGAMVLITLVVIYVVLRVVF